MKFSKIIPVVVISLLLAGGFGACNDDSGIGDSITKEEVDILVDSVFDIEAYSEADPIFDARAEGNMLGHLDVPDYGVLSSSYVARMMVSAICPIPDSIGVDRIDSMKLQIRVKPGQIVGDSVAPQQVKVYALTKQLPNSIDSNFDPKGYYNPSKPLGVANFTLSRVAEADTALYNKSREYVVEVPLPTQMAKQMYEQYMTDASMFAWPSTFARHFPGIYVESSFGRGCIANVNNTSGIIYFHYKTIVNKTIDGVSTPTQIDKVATAGVLAITPEVLNSNIIHFEPSASLQARIAAGEPVVASPGGYRLRIRIPLREILRRYSQQVANLSTFNSLVLRLPVKALATSYGLGLPPELLLIPAAKLDDFLKNNKLPDSKESFWSSYSSITKQYIFSSLVNYLAEKANDPGAMTDADEEFVLIPVKITTRDFYGNEIVTGCTPFVERPCFFVPDMEKTQLRFTFTKQVFN